MQMRLCFPFYKRKAQSGNAMKRRRVHKASVIASETSQKTLCRQETDRVRRASKRASETPEETINSQETGKMRKRASETAERERDKMRKARKRASETPKETMNRQETDRMCKASKRAYETPQQVLQRKQADKCLVSNKRNRSVTIEQTIYAFHSETKGGPDFVCTCCHRMMYRKSVVQCKKSKYTKTKY